MVVESSLPGLCTSRCLRVTAPQVVQTLPSGARSALAQGQGDRPALSRRSVRREARLALLGGRSLFIMAPSSETPLRPCCALTCVPSVVVLRSSFRAVSWAWGAVPALPRKPREAGSAPVLFVMSVLHCLHSVRHETCAQEERTRASQRGRRWKTVCLTALQVEGRDVHAAAGVNVLSTCGPVAAGGLGEST